MKTATTPAWDAHHQLGQTAFTVVPQKVEPNTKKPPPKPGPKKAGAQIQLPGSREQMLKPKGATHNFGAVVDKQANAIHSAKLAGRNFELGNQE